MKIAPLGLVLFACGGPAPATPAPPEPTPTPIESPAPTSDTQAPAPDAGAPTHATGSCPRAEAPAVFVADVAVSSLPRTGAIDGAPDSAARRELFRGTLYQHATLAVGQHQALRVPANALVAEGAKAGVIEVYVAKRLGFAGHPPEPMGVESVRRNLGLATTDDGTTFVIATYGEFDTHIEGGADMQVFVRVPRSFPVRVRADLAGEDSEAIRWPADQASLRESEAGRVGYWYAPVNPRKGWSRVKLIDDAQRVASHAGTYPPIAPARSVCCKPKDTSSTAASSATAPPAPT